MLEHDRNVRRFLMKQDGLMWQYVKFSNDELGCNVHLHATVGGVFLLVSVYSMCSSMRGDV